MKTINIFLAILFVIFAIVQYNDPDPWIWIALYGYIALISVFAVFKKYHLPALILGIIICIIGIGMLIPAVLDWINKGASSITGSMKAESPHVELVREFLGLAIMLGALIFHMITGYKLRRGK